MQISNSVCLAFIVTPDTFVGVVAILIGCAIALSAILNTGAFSRFWISRSLGAKYGTRVAQGGGAAAGILIAIIGLMLLNGILPFRSAVLERTSLPGSTVSRQSNSILHG